MAGSAAVTCLRGRPAIWDVTVQTLGDGDWRPSMNWLDVVELLGE
jgi:hypothetical protein